MSLNRYLLIVLATLLTTQVVVLILAARALAAPSLWAVAVGAAIAGLNTLAAHGLVIWSASRSTSAFMGAVLGGMVARMAFMLAAWLTAVTLLGLPRLALTFSLLSYFMLFLATELAIIHRHAARPAGAAR